MRTPKLFLSLIPLAGLLAIAGCSPSKPEPAPAPAKPAKEAVVAPAPAASEPAPAPAPAAPPIAPPEPNVQSFPTGTFTKGEWTWNFKGDGTYSSQGPNTNDSGTYTTNGNNITLKGKFCGEANGIYMWTLTGSTLTLTVIEDKCGGRQGVVAGAWVKKE